MDLAKRIKALNHRDTEAQRKPFLFACQESPEKTLCLVAFVALLFGAFCNHHPGCAGHLPLTAVVDLLLAISCHKTAHSRGFWSTLAPVSLGSVAPVLLFPTSVAEALAALSACEDECKGLSMVDITAP